MPVVKSWSGRDERAYYVCIKIKKTLLLFELSKKIGYALFTCNRVGTGVCVIGLCSIASVFLFFFFVVLIFVLKARY